MYFIYFIQVTRISTSLAPDNVLWIQCALDSQIWLLSFLG